MPIDPRRAALNAWREERKQKGLTTPTSSYHSNPKTPSSHHGGVLKAKCPNTFTTGTQNGKMTTTGSKRKRRPSFAAIVDTPRPGVNVSPKSNVAGKKRQCSRNDKKHILLADKENTLSHGEKVGTEEKKPKPNIEDDANAAAVGENNTTQSSPVELKTIEIEKSCPTSSQTPHKLFSEITTFCEKAEKDGKLVNIQELEYLRTLIENCRVTNKALDKELAVQPTVNGAILRLLSGFRAELRAVHFEKEVLVQQHREIITNLRRKQEAELQTVASEAEAAHTSFAKQTATMQQQLLAGMQKAVERVNSLKKENEQLKAEVARLQQPGDGKEKETESVEEYSLESTEYYTDSECSEGVEKS
eukprot:g2251.t1